MMLLLVKKTHICVRKILHTHPFAFGSGVRSFWLRNPVCWCPLSFGSNWGSRPCRAGRTAAKGENGGGHTYILNNFQADLLIKKSSQKKYRILCTFLFQNFSAAKTTSLLIHESAYCFQVNKNKQDAFKTASGYWNSNDMHRNIPFMFKTTLY